MPWLKFLIYFFKSEKLLAEIAFTVLEKLVKSTENKLDDKVLELIKEEFGDI